MLRNVINDTLTVSENANALMDLADDAILNVNASVVDASNEIRHAVLDVRETLLPLLDSTLNQFLAIGNEVETVELVNTTADAASTLTQFLRATSTRLDHVIYIVIVTSSVAVFLLLVIVLIQAMHLWLTCRASRRYHSLLPVAPRARHANPTSDHI